MEQTLAIGSFDGLSETLSLSWVRFHILVSRFDGGDPDHAPMIGGIHLSEFPSRATSRRPVAPLPSQP